MVRNEAGDVECGKGLTIYIVGARLSLQHKKPMQEGLTSPGTRHR